MTLLGKNEGAMDGHFPYQFVDVHFHASPDMYSRKLTAFAAGEIYRTFDAAVVLKSHLGSTGVHATLAQDMGLPVLPSVVLNKCNGGIDYRVILRALAEYQGSLQAKMIVDFPTITGRVFSSKLSRKWVHPNLQQDVCVPETLFNEHGQLKSSALDVLKMASDYPIVISSGHASKQEVLTLVDACVQHNVPSLLLNQPAHPLTGLTAAELKDLLQYRFIWVEQTALTFLIGHQEKEDFRQVLTHLPRVIYSSDLGQTTQMGVAEWVQFSENIFDEFNLSEFRRQEIWAKNPMALLELKA
jgi:hypothetical protein